MMKVCKSHIPIFPSNALLARPETELMNANLTSEEHERHSRDQ